jgi:hypothetical protein
MNLALRMEKNLAGWHQFYYGMLFSRIIIPHRRLGIGKKPKKHDSI